MGASQHRAAVPSSSVFGGAAWGTIGDLVAVLFGDDHLAVLACIRLGVEGAAVGRRQAGEVWVVCGRGGAGGRALEGRDEGQACQPQRRGMVIEAVAGKGRKGLVGGRCDAWVASGAGRGRGLGADDGRRTVGLAEVGQRDLRRPELAIVVISRWEGRRARRRRQSLSAPLALARSEGSRGRQHTVKSIFCSVS